MDKPKFEHKTYSSSPRMVSRSLSGQRGNAGPNPISQNRRDFLRHALYAGAGCLILPLSCKLAVASQIRKSVLKKQDDEHFFLMITLPNASGVDGSYLWDARPLEMTGQGIIQNYLGTEPLRWTGVNGVSTLASSLVSPLEAYRSDFTVVNGVHMDVGFDGHEQNINYLFTGDPFGGECFLPHLNVLGQQHKALDAIQRGRYAVAQSNGAQMVPLNPSAARSLIASLGKVPAVDPNSRLIQFLSSRFASNGGGAGAFSSSSALMGKSFAQSGALSGMFNQIRTSGNDTDAGFIELAAEIFRTGVSKSAVLVLDPDENVFDTHDPASASRQPKTYQSLVSQLATVFAAMKATRFDSGRSLLDVTTVMFAGEFGRSLRQKNHAITATGTDHNPLSNCVLVGGKGIKGGQVIGSSDYLSANETLSGAHLSLDAEKYKTMGKPFDFAQSRSRNDLPAVYAVSDYLGFSSVVNTLYQLFGVADSHYRLVERNGAKARVVQGLLS